MVERATEGDHCRKSSEVDYRAEVEEWEEPLHPGSLRANIPHFLPQRNSDCTFSPTKPSSGPSVWRNACKSATSRAGSGQPPTRRMLQAGVQKPILRERLQRLVGSQARRNRLA